MTNTTQDQNRFAEREERTVVVERSSGGGAFAAIGIILALFVAIVLAYLVLSQSGGGTLDIDVPAVSVDVVPDGQ